MEQDRRQAKHLLKKSFLAALSDTEALTLADLLEKLTIHDQQQVFEEACEEINEGNSIAQVNPFSTEEKAIILNKVFHERPKRHTNKSQGLVHRFTRQYISYVAACFILIFLFISILVRRNEASDSSKDLQRTARLTTANDSTEQIPFLRTNHGDKIPLDSISLGTTVSGDNYQIVRLASGELQYQPTDGYKGSDRHSIITPKATMINFILPDGSKVWLNASSLLTFNLDMNTKDRCVEVQGEAYFEVSKRREQKFKVRGKFGEIEVLGTKFNVNGYNRQETAVGLLEGSIRLHTERKRILMRPKELTLVLADGSTKTSRQAEIEDIVTWKEGYFNFKNADIHTVAAEISRWYDLPVSVVGQHGHKEINGKISRSLKLANMLEMLNYLGVEGRYKDNKLIIHIK